MFPDVGEFNLVMAGLATFAATVGYACTRRLSTSSASSRPELHTLQRTPTQTETDMQVDIDNDVKPVDDEKESMTMEHDSTSPASIPPVTQAPPTATIIAASASVPSEPATTLLTPVRRESLKRKAPEDGFDEPKVEDRGYPYNLANIYPNKRSRTPSSDSLASTPSASSQLTREPSPALESIIDTTFNAVVVTHMETSSSSISTSAVSEQCSTIDPAPTPATEPPTSPSPVPSPRAAVLEIQEVEDATPAPARSPTPISTPLFAPSPLFTALNTPAPVNLALAADAEKVESKITKADKSALPPALSPWPVLDATRKPFPNTGFAAFANQDAFAPSRPTTPKSTFTSTSSGFAAFAGSASPFAAAAALNRPTTAAPSLFGPTPTSFFRLKPTTNAVSSGSAFVLPNANIFGSSAAAGAGANNIFGASAAAGNGNGNIFGNGGSGSKTELVTAEKFLDGVLGSKNAVVPATQTGVDVPNQDKAAKESTKDASGDAETGEKEEREREAREKEESEKEAARLAARAKAEEEVRLQEAREKQVRKEAKLRERKTGHAIVEANATAPTEKFIPLTGEEDEDVEIEQRGVKLYIKRGDRPFSEGIPGLIKLLVNRTTAEERILFRREPLLKVSMNVRVQSTVRITFVPEENVLRCILKEMVPPAEGEDGEPKQEVAIYVIKPARAGSKQDFKSFAENLMERLQLKEGAEKLKTRSA